eukprot:RCo048578
MEASQTLSQQLGRPLTALEGDVLRSLSAQGMARLNQDMISGANLENTLAELSVLFLALQCRHKQLLGAGPLSEVGRAIAAQMARAPSTVELLLLRSETPGPILRQICEQLAKGDGLEDIMEDLAHTHLVERLGAEAQALAGPLGYSAGVTRLAPTRVDLTKLDIGCSAAAVVDPARRRVRVGPCPMLAWFDEKVLLLSLEGTVNEAEPVSVPVAAPASPRKIRAGPVKDTTVAARKAVSFTLEDAE